MNIGVRLCSHHLSFHLKMQIPLKSIQVSWRTKNRLQRFFVVMLPHGEIWKLWTVYYVHWNIVKHNFFIVWQTKYHDKGFNNDKYLHLYSLGKGTMENGLFQNVAGARDGTFYSLGEGTLFSLGNGKLYPLGTIFPLGMGPLILWDSGHPLGNGTRYPLGFGPPRTYIHTKLIKK